MTKNIETTFDRWMKDPRVKKEYEKERADFILSEIFHAMKEGNNQSVRTLAKKIGISPSVIQNINSGNQRDIRLKNFVSIAHEFGFSLVLEKDDTRISL